MHDCEKCFTLSHMSSIISFSSYLLDHLVKFENIFLSRSLHVKNIRKFLSRTKFSSSPHETFQILRVQSSEGTKRVEFTAQDTNKKIYEKVRRLNFFFSQHLRFRLLKHLPYHPSMILRYTKRKTNNHPLLEQRRK